MESLRDNLKTLFNDLIVELDDQVTLVGESQCGLDQQLDSLIEMLDQIKLNNELTQDISEKAKKISLIKRRLTLIHTILRNSTLRCNRLMASSKIAADQITVEAPNSYDLSNALSTVSEKETASIQPSSSRIKEDLKSYINLVESNLDRRTTK